MRDGDFAACSTSVFRRQPQSVCGCRRAALAIPHFQTKVDQHCFINPCSIALSDDTEADSDTMKQSGLDGRHRDGDGEIDQKHGNTLNMHLSPPIPQFSPETTLQEMRDKTGKVSEADVREAAKRL